MERSTRTWIVPPLLAALVMGACSQPAVEDTVDDGVDEEWREVSFTIPPYPKPDSLVAFEADEPGANHDYYMDVDNLSLGGDEVWRYTVAIETGSGTRNVMFEGVRCGVREYKTYAVGTADGKLLKVRKPTWRSVQRRGPMAYRNALIESYLCDDLRWPIPREVVVKRFRRGWWGYGVDRMELQPQGNE